MRSPTPQVLVMVCLAAALGGCGSRPPAGGPDAKPFADFRGAKDAPTYRAPAVETAPTIDGQMDPAYRSAGTVRLVFINGDDRQPKAPTTAYAVCTQTALYVLFRCRVADPKALAWTRRTHDSDVWQDNSVEVFLEPTGTGSGKYYQVVVNPGGTSADLLSRDPKAWNPKLKIATAVGPREWTAEIEIPFDQLGIESGRVNKVWRMNLTRFTTAPAEDTSWCVLGDYSSHVPRRFGYLWVDAGTRLNVAAQDLMPWRPLFNARSLAGWTVRSGRPRVRDGAIVVGPGRSAVILLDKPLPDGDVEIAAEISGNKQFRFAFSPDAGNEKMGLYGTFINHINESNVAMMKNWEYWVPPLGWHLTIPHYGPCGMNDRDTYACVVRFRAKRISLVLNGRILLETPNFYPKARHFGLAILGGGRVTNIRLRALAPEAPDGGAR